MHVYNTNNTNKQNWQTPNYFYKYLDDTHHFTLDPFSNGTDNKTPLFLTDSFNVDWVQYCKDNNKECIFFCNPPYAQPNIEMTLSKCYDESLNGGKGVVLIPNAPAKYWDKHVFDKATKITLIVGRLQFIDPTTGKEKKGNGGYSCLIEYGDNPTGKTQITRLSLDSL
jgi:phage N-6-adenine-methyltransferase